MTRPSRIALMLALFGLFATGCSNLNEGRPGLANRWRTMASSGGSSLPTESGPPGAAVSAELGELETAPRSDGRISGRVIDPKGRPVPNAEVRLADGTSRVGKDLHVTTDDAGGFTIRGLRPGGSYTLIAEGDDGRDTLVGRASARAPSGNVRILLSQDDSDTSKQTAEADDAEEVSPAKRVGRVSGSREIDDEDTASGDDPFAPKKPSARVNVADLPPAEEVEPDNATPLQGSSEKPPRGRWKRDSNAAPEAVSQDRSSSAAAVSKEDLSKPALKSMEDEGPNPLPPAKEKPSETLLPPATEPPVPVEKALEQPINPAPAVDTSPSEPPSTHEGPPSSLPVDSASIPAQVAPKRRATWAEVATDASSPKLAMGSAMPISIRRGSQTDSEPAAADKPVRPGPMGLKDRKADNASRANSATVAATCRFDAKTQRLVDFQLPDLDGKPIHFKDLDADFVLIDFWGTWCKPCVESIPHLVELQSKYGSKTLRVVGVATEQNATTSQKAQRVDKVAQSLGVNYPLLLSEADGKPCPLQQALHVQAYPTMILVDRSGQILWRGTGAEGVTLSKLDKIIAVRTDQDAVRR